MHSSFIYYLLWNAKCLSPLKSWDNGQQSAYAILDYYISFPITGDDLNLVRQGSHLSSLYTEMTLWLTLKLYICITLLGLFFGVFFTISTLVGLWYITHAPRLVLPIHMTVVKVTCSQKMTNWYFLLFRIFKKSMKLKSKCADSNRIIYTVYCWNSFNYKSIQKECILSFRQTFLS